jgi:hypothetical protein
MSAPPKNSPWGKPDSVEEIAPGIWHVSTPSHGGLKLAPELNKQVPDYLRNAGGWYEEDLDWAAAAVVFPQFFSEEVHAAAVRTLKNWRPLEYELFFGETIPPGESMMKDQEQWNLDHKNDWVVISAVGDWHAGVPEGMVGVWASKGGRNRQYKITGEVRTYLVPAWEYDDPHPFGFVVDPARHERIADL